MAILRIYAHFSKFFKLSAFDWDGVVLPRYLALIKRWKAADLAAAGDEELLQGIRELAAEDSHYWFGSAVNLGLSRLMDSLFNRFLKFFLIRYALPAPRPVSASFLRGFDSKVLDAQTDLEALANRIRQSETLRDLVLRTDPAQLMEALAAHPAGQPALDGLDP